jgi:hypothetical protein
MEPVGLRRIAREGEGTAVGGGVSSRPAGLEHVTDRLGAVGGRLVMEQGSLVAELPLDSEG